MLPAKDPARLRHMLEFAQKAVHFCEGKTLDDLVSDEVLGMAVVHLVELIGEAARGVSQALRQRYPKVPWNRVIGTRDRLIHAYIDVDLEIIWTIVDKDLPPLIAQLERILKKEHMQRQFTNCRTLTRHCESFGWLRMNSRGNLREVGGEYSLSLDGRDTGCN